MEHRLVEFLFFGAGFIIFAVYMIMPARAARGPIAVSKSKIVLMSLVDGDVLTVLHILS